MNFRTQVELPVKQTEIIHSSKLMLLGSCFAENIGNLLQENKFRCDVNPFGVLYNPMSISKALQQLLEKKTYKESDLFCFNKVWYSWMHHGTFSSLSSEECLNLINSRLKAAANALSSLDWLIITWGTAYVYIHQERKEVVGNCHKLPERTFQRIRLNVSEIVEEWRELLYKMRELNPQLKVLFTISPIRHVKDGLHGNQLSKATLLLAVEELCQTCSDCFYFPSYEIMMDELRDYRFYQDDMLHPSQVAIQYLWECFSNCFFKPETRKVLHEWSGIRRGLEHRPVYPDSESYRSFISQIVLKITEMKEKLPYLEVQKELELCESRLKI